MKSFSLGLVGLGIVGMVAGIAGCPSSFVGCEEGPCGSDGGAVDGSQADTSTDAGADREPPPGCTTPEEPLKNPEKCLVDSFGAFVSPTGDDGNPGTKAKPFKTIGKALGTTQTRIVVCEGTYGEALDLGRDVDIYGAIACTFDKAGAATKIESGKTTGLTVSRGTVGLFGVSVTAVDATEPGESSVGIVVGSGVTFKMVGGSVTAGTGSSPPDATTTSNYTAIPQSDPKIKGNDGTGNAGGVTQTCAMLGCTELGAGVEGGAGGLGSGAGGSPGFDGKTANAALPTYGRGGVYTAGPPQCGTGVVGADGVAGNGGAGATTPFTIESNKLTATRGTAGQTARPGQGGGGGSGGMSATTGGGGSGGCGGCGGGKGQGGLSGGSSFAVLSVAANVSLDNVTLKASAGGKGGKGGDGQVGQLGGAAGLPALAGIGCPGGLGGQGGQGGGGGGGAGGHSAAVAYTGTKPSMKGVTPEVAQTPAAGGDPGTSAATVTQATAGAPGKTGTELAL